MAADDSAIVCVMCQADTAQYTTVAEMVFSQNVVGR